MFSRLKGKFTWLSWNSMLAALRAIGIWFIITLAIAFVLAVIDFAINAEIGRQDSPILTAIWLVAVGSIATLFFYGIRNKWDKATWVSVIAFVLLVGILLSARYWGELRGSEESLSATVRNVGLLIGAVVAALLAMWRSVVAGRQVDIAEQGMLGERYRQGAEMLGSDVLSVRLGGIHALGRLAKEHSEEYHTQAMESLCAFARHPTNDARFDASREEDTNASAGEKRLRNDVETAMIAIASRNDERVAIESRAKFRLYLRGARLSHLRIRDANLENAWLYGADLSYAMLSKANLRGANLQDVILSGSDLTGADLSNLDIKAVDRQSSDNGKTVITQCQLDRACADPDNPPKLEGVMDAETGKPLVWRGKARVSAVGDRETALVPTVSVSPRVTVKRTTFASTIAWTRPSWHRSQRSGLRFGGALPEPQTLNSV